MKDFVILGFFIGILVLTIIAVYLATKVGTKRKKLRGKYIIIHHVYIGNINDEVDVDRIKQLETSGDILKENFGLDMTPLEAYMLKYKSQYSLKHQYDDLAEELFIPTRDVTKVEIVDLNKPKTTIRVTGGL